MSLMPFLEIPTCAWRVIHLVTRQQQQVDLLNVRCLSKKTW